MRRKVKDSMWWNKQKEKEKNKQAASEESKKSQLCKYFLNGNCKNVSTGCRIIVCMCVTKYRSAIFGDFTVVERNSGYQ